MSKVNLYPHNQTAYLKIKQVIENGDTKMAIAHATGTGKSYISARLFEDYNDDQKLVLVPTNFLYQSHKGLFDEYGIQNTNVMTYQSLIKKDSEEIDNMNYKVVILDEYHHSTAQKWGESVRELIKSHPETIFLGTSATPVRTDGVNTIDEMFDSNCVSELPVSKAIALGILPMPRYVAVDYAYDKRFDELAKKVDKSSCTKEEKEEYHKQIKEMRLHVDQSYGMPIILNKYIENESGKYIVFCRNKKHLEEIKGTVIEWFNQAGFRNVNSYVVHSQNEEKDKEFQEFNNDDSGSLKLLFCINMLSEGLHLKGISGVILLRTTSSYIVFQQQIGRALAANNRVIPLIIDAVNNYSYVQDGIKLFDNIKKECKEYDYNPNNNINLCDIDSFLIIDQVQNVEKLFLSIEEAFCCNFARWTDDEINLLKDTYIKYGISKCIEVLPNRTKEAIQTKIRDLKIRKRKAFARWSKDEECKLKEYYLVFGPKKCAELLNRPLESVYTKARKYKLHYNANKWSDDEISILKEKYPIMGKKCIEYLPNRSEDSIQGKAFNLGIGVNNDLKYNNKKSKYRYVHWRSRIKKGKWEVSFYIGYKRKYFGSYDDEDEAGRMAKEKAKEYGKHWPEDLINQ